MTLLKSNRTFSAVGAPDQLPGCDNQELISHRRMPPGSLIHIQDINSAQRKVRNEDVRFRYVIDMASL